MRKVLSSLVVVVSVAAMGGCGQSGGDKAIASTTTAATSSTERSTTSTTARQSTTTTEASDGSKPVTAWATEFCGSFKDWLDHIKGASSNVGANVSSGNIPSAKTAIVGLFATVHGETRTLINTMQSQGTPDIPRGGELVDDLVAKFEDFDTAITAAQTDASNLPTNDPSAFQTQVSTLVDSFQTETSKIGDSFSELDTKYNDASLDAALGASCAL